MRQAQPLNRSQSPSSPWMSFRAMSPSEMSWTTASVRSRRRARSWATSISRALSSSASPCCKTGHRDDIHTGKRDAAAASSTRAGLQGRAAGEPCRDCCRNVLSN